MLSNLGRKEIGERLPDRVDLDSSQLFPQRPGKEYWVLKLELILPRDIELCRLRIERICRIDRRLGRIRVLTQRALGGADCRWREAGGGTAGGHGLRAARDTERGQTSRTVQHLPARGSRSSERLEGFPVLRIDRR